MQWADGNARHTAGERADSRRKDERRKTDEGDATNKGSALAGHDGARARGEKSGRCGETAGKGAARARREGGAERRRCGAKAGALRAKKERRTDRMSCPLVKMTFPPSVTPSTLALSAMAPPELPPRGEQQGKWER